MSRTGVRRRGAARIGLVLTLSLVGAAWAAPTLELLGGDEPVPVARSTYVVREGDTLWSIALYLAPGEDPRPVVDALAAVNAVQAGELVPGQSLVIPAGS